MGGPARLAFALAVAGTSLRGQAQEPPRPPGPAEHSPGWILQIRSDADFEFADRAAAVDAARVVLAAEEKFARDLRDRALKLLFWDAHYGGRKAEAAALLDRLRDACPDDPEAALRPILQGGINSREEIPQRVRDLEEFLRQRPAYPPAWWAVTQLLIGDGRADEAGRKLEGALKQHRRDGLLLVARAAVFRARGEHRKALDDLDAAFVCEPQIRFIDLQYIQRAEVLCALNRPDEALAFCALALQLKPPHVNEQAFAWTVSDLASRCYQTLGKHELAYCLAKVAGKAAPQQSESWLRLAETCADSGRYAEGKRALDRLAALGPASPRASLLGARLRSGLHDETGALAAARAGRKDFPADPGLARFECLLLATATTDEVRDPRRAKEIAAAVLTGPAADPSCLCAAAVAYAADGDYVTAGDLAVRAEAAAKGSPPPLRQTVGEAKEFIRTRARIVPHLPDPVEDTGDDLRPRPRWIEEVTSDWDFELMPVEVAEQHCVRVVADESQDIGLRTKAIEVLTRLRHRQGQNDGARRGYAALVQLAPADPAPRRGQIDLDAAGKPPAERATLWERFCADFPGDAEGRAQWAYELLWAGRPGRADEVLAAAAREAPEHPRVLHVKAVAALRRGCFADAIDFIDRRLCCPDLKGLRAAAYVVKAEALGRLGRYDEALANLAVARRLSAHPEFLAPVSRIASLCYLFQGRDALAFQVASRWAAAGGDPAQSNLLAATAAVLGDDLADAAACLDRVSTSGPAAARADLVRAVLKLRQGDQAGCRDALDRGFPKYPADEANRCALAMHLTFATDERVRDPRRALDIAKAGVAAGSALEPVRAVCLANAYADTGEFGKAIEVLYEPAGLDERQWKAVREAFERRQPLRHDHNASKWMQRQLLLHSQIDGR